MIYLAFRFEWRFPVSAIIANLHDVVIILGLLRLLPVGVLAFRAGSDSGGARLFGERDRSSSSTASAKPSGKCVA